MQKILFLFFLLPLYSLSCQAQSGFLPENLGPTVNSTYPELYPTLSADGKTLFFVRANHPENHFGATDSQDIWCSYLQEDGTWGLAKHMEAPFNTARYNAVLSASDDGKTLYIYGIYHKKDLRWKKRGISSITILGPLDYSKPVPVKVKGFHKMDRGKYGQVYINGSENVMLISMARLWGMKHNNLFVSLKNPKNGKWKKPKKLKKPISKWGTEYAPYLSKGGDTLYFAAQTKKGTLDLYASKRTDEKYRKWTEPVKMDTLSSIKWDCYYALNPKGSYAYYVSNSTGEGSTDIFRIKRFEENPFISINGTVLNKKTLKPITTGNDIHLLIDHVPVDTITVDKETGKFKLTLPLGHVYELNTQVLNYVGIPDTIDVSDKNTYAEVSQTLYADPIPFILLRGRLLIKNSPESLSSSRNPKIFVNGQPADSVQIDQSGNYQMKLEYGRAYVIQVKAKSYTPGERKLDLRNIKEYQEMAQDLYVSKTAPPKVKQATMTGKIINSKTMRPLPPGIPVEIHVNDFPSINVSIQDSNYTLKLPLGHEYEINASAKNFYPSMESIDLKHEKDIVKIFKDLYVSPLTVGESVKLENIFFETGKAVLKPESYTELDRVVRLMADYPTIKIEIGGHTDNVGNADFNKTLSQERANSVANYLIAKGISENRIQAKGYGMEKPVASNDTPEGKQENRRVEFTILEK